MVDAFHFSGRDPPRPASAWPARSMDAKGVLDRAWCRHASYQEGLFQTLLHNLMTGRVRVQPRTDRRDKPGGSWGDFTCREASTDVPMTSGGVYPRREGIAM